MKSRQRAASLRGRSRLQQVLDGLEAIFLREGFRRVTMGELTARLHCSRQTLYRLAPSKSDLFSLILDRVLARIRREAAEAAHAATSTQQRIRALVEPGIREMHQASPWFLADVSALPAARRLFEQHKTARRRQAEACIKDGIRRGDFRRFHSRLVAEVVVAALERVMEPDFLVEAGLTPSTALREAEDLLLQGLLAPTRQQDGAGSPEAASGKGRTKGPHGSGRARD